jgi:hypothetical protein
MPSMSHPLWRRKLGLNLGLEEDGKEDLKTAKPLKMNGRNDWIRTSGLFRVKAYMVSRINNLQNLRIPWNTFRNAQKFLLDP